MLIGRRYNMKRYLVSDDNITADFEIKFTLFNHNRY